MPDGDAHGEIYGAAHALSERAATARFKLAARIGDVIERFKSRVNGESRDTGA